MSNIAVKDVAKNARRDSEFWFPDLHADPTNKLGLHYALGLAGEVGEVCNLLKKVNRKDRKKISKNDLSDELADVFTYLMLLADANDIDLMEAYFKKREHNKGRWGDPEGQS